MYVQFFWMAQISHQKRPIYGPFSCNLCSFSQLFFYSIRFPPTQQYSKLCWRGNTRCHALPYTSGDISGQEPGRNTLPAMHVLYNFRVMYFRPEARKLFSEIYLQRYILANSSWNREEQMESCNKSSKICGAFIFYTEKLKSSSLGITVVSTVSSSHLKNLLSKHFYNGWFITPL